MTKEKNLEKLVEKFMKETQSILTPRERDVVRLYFGFDDGHRRIPEEIGQLFSITKDSVKEILNSAIKKVENNELFLNIMQIHGYKMLFNSLYENLFVSGDKTEEMISVLDKLMEDALEENQRDVLKYRLGIMDGKQKSLEETGKIIGLSAERIRQIEAASMRRIHHPSRLQELRDFAAGIEKEDKENIAEMLMKMKNNDEK